ncbi:MAG: NAD(P)-binding protein [Deltaproteobacteria bacterium]|nr:NAD(P)-binding protein [Deltaproteobacteria bacterium]
MIAIIGAGLTGLSLAYHLKKKSYEVFEKADAPGGLCRSVTVDGFTFDYTGHLLHMRSPLTKRLAERLMPGMLQKIARRAAIYCYGRYIPYPFQANLYGLPREVVFECLKGIMQVGQATGRHPGARNFKSWVVETFGPGMAKHFFLPYNEKLWQLDLRRLTSEWAQWSIPRPNVEEVLRGALGIANDAMGYNAHFYYPRKGGITCVPDALARRLHSVRLNCRLTAINVARKKITLSDGSSRNYDRLVSTVPLPQLLRMIEDLPQCYRVCARYFSSVSVLNINLGINRKKISDYHWMYFPGAEFPFYRVGVYSNISPALAPRNTSSLYVEIAAKKPGALDESAAVDASLEGLRRCGILKKNDRVCVTKLLPIEHAYVHFTPYREQKLPQVMEWLQQHGIMSIGRYGAWDYLAMEDSLLQGRESAKLLQ